MSDFVIDKRLDDLKLFIKSIKGADNPESYLIATLHKAQELYGYLAEEIMDVISQELQIPTAHIWGVATFYHYFKLVPQGKHSISVCLGTACYVKGSAEIVQTLKDILKVEVGQTSEDGLFTLHEARCLGACGLAPVMMIDDKIYGNLTPKSTGEIIESIKKQEKK